MFERFELSLAVERFERSGPVERLERFERAAVIGERYESSCEPARFADARQAGRRITGRRNMDLRTEMGWVPCPGVSRRRRGPDPEPRRKIAQPLLSGTARTASVTAARALCA